MEIHMVIHFERGYLSDPFWPELARLIDIEKQSGVNRARSDPGREKALVGWLTANNMTRGQYDALKAAAARPFHFLADGEIIIPSAHIMAALAEAGNLCPSALRVCRNDQVRSILSCSDLRTGKTLADALVWERLCPPKSASGALLSHQRGLRRNFYLEHFDATGLLTTRMEKDRIPALRDFVAWSGAEVGCGASRAMGWGTWSLVELEAA